MPESILYFLSLFLNILVSFVASRFFLFVCLFVFFSPFLFLLVAWRSGLDFLVFPFFFPVATLYIHGTDICMYDFFIFSLAIFSLFSRCFIVKIHTGLPFPGALC